MEPGTIIRLPDRREGTIVFHGLHGYGFQWGRIPVDKERILNTSPLFGEQPENWPYDAEAFLREPGAISGFECVGTEYEIVELTGAGVNETANNLEYS